MEFIFAPKKNIRKESVLSEPNPIIVYGDKCYKNIYIGIAVVPIEYRDEDYLANPPPGIKYIGIGGKFCVDRIWIQNNKLCALEKNYHIERFIELKVNVFNLETFELELTKSITNLPYGEIKFAWLQEGIAVTISNLFITGDIYNNYILSFDGTTINLQDTAYEAIFGKNSNLGVIGVNKNFHLTNEYKIIVNVTGLHGVEGSYTKFPSDTYHCIIKY